MQGGSRFDSEFPRYEGSYDHWRRAAALSVVILALLAVLAVLKASGAALKGQAAAGLEARQWGSYQEMGNREEVLRLSRDLFTMEKLLEHKSVRVQKLVGERLKEVEGELTRLDQERQRLRAEAEAAAQVRQLWDRRTNAFIQAALLLLAALGLAAASGLIQKKLPWLVGLALGLAGIVWLINAFFLWF